MIFKTKKFNIISIIFAFMLVIINSVGCEKSTSSKIKMYQLLDDGCPSFNWIYTDFVFPGSCVQANNYNGSTDTAFQVAGVCTTTVTDETNSGVGAYLQTTPIIVECATGSLSSSFEYASFAVTETFDDSDVFPQANDQINITVECSVHGTVRDKQSLTYTYSSSCLVP